MSRRAYQYGDIVGFAVSVLGRGSEAVVAEEIKRGGRAGLRMIGEMPLIDSNAEVKLHVRTVSAAADTGTTWY
jgi:hypothetical protein